MESPIGKWIIDQHPPSSWSDLQVKVFQIFSEMGFAAEVEKTITTVRGNVEIDVYAEDYHNNPPVTYLCECKRWKSRLPKAVVHGFRTVINDFGANWGLIIASGGFQRGAKEAAQHSNVRLLSWEAFQSMFAERWYVKYMIPHLRDENAELVYYTELIYNLHRDPHSDEQVTRLRELRRKHLCLNFMVSQLCSQVKDGSNNPSPLIRATLGGDEEDEEDEWFVLDYQRELPRDVLIQTSLRGIFDTLLKHIRNAVAEFDTALRPGG